MKLSTLKALIFILSVTSISLTFYVSWLHYHGNCNSTMSMFPKASRVSLVEQNFDLPNPSGTCSVSKLNWDSANRKDRFPSVEERICHYMNVWYDPHWRQSNQWVSPLKYVYTNEKRNSRFKQIFVSWNNITNLGVLLRNKISPDVPFHILMEEEEDVIRDLATYGRQKSILQYIMTMWSDTSGRIELRKTLFSYGSDMMVFINILRETVQTQPKERFPPILSQFGDNELDIDLPLPLFGKWRYNNPKHHRKPIPIILKLESERHYDTPFPIVLKKDIPWEQKLNKAIYRGMMSGHNLEEDMIAEDYLCRRGPGRERLYTNYEACMKVPRCRFVYKSHNSTLIDAKLWYTFHEFTHINGRAMVSGKMSIADQLKYKIIISFEGNDVATGLKWNLLSNSVVLMPKPTKTTWAMENRLEPWVHYVPITSNNVEEMVAWVIKHSNEARKIAERSTNFIHDLFLHPDAEKDGKAVMKEIAMRYASLW